MMRAIVAFAVVAVFCASCTRPPVNLVLWPFLFALLVSCLAKRS